MSTYRGRDIDHAIHNRKADTYSLIGAGGDCVAELKTHEFFALPNRKSMEVRSGRYRPAGSKDQRSANGKSDQSGRDDPFAILPQLGPWIPFDPGQSNQGPRPSLILADIRRAKALFTSPFTNCTIIEEAPKPPLKREGIIAGEIVGYRCWRIERGILASVYQPDVWNPGQVLEGRELGDWDHRGIHAWKSAASKQYHAYVRSYLNSSDTDVFASYFARIGAPDNRHRSKTPAMVTGTVFLWGDVVEYERGWRAEFARVRSLDWLYPDETMMGREQEMLDDLRHLYGVT